MGFGKPTEARRTVRALVILTILAWATHTLLAQWGYGAEVSGQWSAINVQPPIASEEKFVPAPPSLRTANIELRSEAIVSGAAIRLKQIARWADHDGAALTQTSDVVVARFERGQSTRAIELDELKGTLQQAGISLSAINFNGALVCTVRRNDSALDASPQQAVAAFIAKAPTTVPSVIPALNTFAQAVGESRTLKDLLLADLAERFALPSEVFQLHFTGQEEKLANLSEPLFRFEIDRPIQRDIGDVTWPVTIGTPAGTQKTTISANVRAWQTRLFAARPIVARQQFRDEDVVEKRILVDHLGDELSPSKGQVVGQQAARDIPVGTILNSRMIEAIQLARVGELVDVYVERGRIQLKWVAEARENGSLGQTIRVRKVGERDEFTVVLIGQRQGKLVGVSPANVAASR